MSALPPDLTENYFMTAIRSFLLSVLPTGVEVFQGQANFVPEPAGADFIVMTPMGRVRMAYNVDRYDEQAANPTTVDISTSTQFTVQLDIHGPNGSDYAQTVTALFTDDYGVQLDPTGRIAPLYTTDGTQMPFINAENQYENRWIISLVLQGSPTISTPQDFAAILHTTLIPIIGG